MKAKQLAQVWEAAESDEEKSQAVAFIIQELISEVEWAIGRDMADTHEEVIRILEQVQKKWHVICHRCEELKDRRELFQYAIKKYDQKVYDAWMAKKN
nr:hypothetical protein 52 [Balneolaceae bacterium]